MSRKRRKRTKDNVTTAPGFDGRELTNADKAWWAVWHANKDDLRKAGFSVDRVADRCLLPYAPRGALRSDPDLDAQRDAAWNAYRQARDHLLGLYSNREWPELLARVALAELDKPPSEAERMLDAVERIQSSEPPREPPALRVIEGGLPPDETLH